MQTERFGGADRYETALAIARSLVSDSGGMSERVVIASGRSWTDAVVAAPLTAPVGGGGYAPLLLSDPRSGLTPAVVAFIEDIGASSAVIVSTTPTQGSAAVPRRVDSQLKSIGVTTERLGGADASATSLAVAEHLAQRGSVRSSASSPTVFVASAEVFADSLVAGPLAARIAPAAPILLTAPSALPSSVTAWLRDRSVSRAVVMGGTAAVSSNVDSQLGSLGVTAERIAGSSRYDTAVRAAQWAGANLPACTGPARAGLAVGTAPWDSFSSVPLLASRCAPLLLTSTGKVPASTAGYLDTIRGSAGDGAVQLLVFGGESAVATSAIDAYLAGGGTSGANDATPSTQTIEVVLCGQKGGYDFTVGQLSDVETPEDLLEGMVAQLNEDVSPYWQRQSSGVSRLEFVEAGVVVSKVLEDRAVDPITIFETCIDGYQSRQRRPSTTYLVYLPRDRGGGGIATLGDIIVAMDHFPTDDAALSSMDQMTVVHFGTELHELGHIILRVGHTRVGAGIWCTLMCGGLGQGSDFTDRSRYTLRGFPYFSLDGVTPVVEDQAPNGDTVSRPGSYFSFPHGSGSNRRLAVVNVEGEVPEEGLSEFPSLANPDLAASAYGAFACYEREFAGWPVGGNSPPCVRLPPDHVEFEAVDAPPFYQDPDGDWVSEVVNGKFAVAWRPPAWTDGAPILGYVIRVRCLALDDSAVGIGREGVIVSERVVSSSARSAILDFDASVLGDGRPCDRTLSTTLDPSVIVSVSAVSKYGEGVNFGARVEGFDAEPSVKGRFKSLSNQCAVTVEGSIFCWGRSARNPYAQDPRQGWEVIEAPTRGTFTSISSDSLTGSGEGYLCALKSDNSIVCWGNIPAGKYPPAGSFTSVSTSGNVACAIKSDGSLVCWGNIPTDWHYPTGAFTSVSIGVGYRPYSCALRSDGSIVCWGGHRLRRPVPPAGTFTSISAGDDRACAVKSDGSIVCWGESHDPLVGGWTWSYEGPTGAYKSISAGGQYTCAVKSDDSIVCWFSDRVSRAESIAGVYKSVVTVPSGDFNFCALRADDSIVCRRHTGEFFDISLPASQGPQAPAEQDPQPLGPQDQWDSSKSNIVENVAVTTTLWPTDDGELARITLTFDPVPGAFYYSVKNPFHDPSVSHDQIGDGWPIVNHDLSLPILTTRTPPLETWYTGAYGETVTFKELRACSPAPGTGYDDFGWPRSLLCGTPVDVDLVIPAP